MATTGAPTPEPEHGTGLGAGLETSLERALEAGTVERPDVVELANELRFVVARLHRQLRQQDSSGLSPSLATALATVARNGEITLGRLAACEQVSPPTITRIVEQLVARGLVSRRVDDDDKRVSLVRATTAGRRRLEAIRTRRTAWLASRLGEIDTAEVECLRQALGVLEALLIAPIDRGGAP